MITTRSSLVTWSALPGTRIVGASGSRSSLFVTITFPSCCSTCQQATGDRAGARNLSPVRTLKQAWCHQQ